MLMTPEEKFYIINSLARNQIQIMPVRELKPTQQPTKIFHMNMRHTINTSTGHTSHVRKCSMQSFYVSPEFILNSMWPVENVSIFPRGLLDCCTIGQR